MPTYQYACKECDHQFDAAQSFSDPSLTDCPECAGALRKLFGSVGVIFKGSGFYRNDSRSRSASSGNDEKSGTGSGSSEGKSETKSEGKSEGKPETSSAGSNEKKPAVAASTAGTAKAS
ncbi:MAG: FmdB family zinc ribbon protein [Pseudonocardiaceae bacterium]